MSLRCPREVHSAMSIFPLYKNCALFFHKFFDYHCKFYLTIDEAIVMKTLFFNSIDQLMLSGAAKEKTIDTTVVHPFLRIIIPTKF